MPLLSLVGMMIGVATGVRSRRYRAVSCVTQSTAEPKQEDEMKRLMAVAAMLFMMPVAAGAQDAIPALKGTWRGTGKIPVRDHGASLRIAA